MGSEIRVDLLIWNPTRASSSPAGTHGAISPGGKLKHKQPHTPSSETHRVIKPCFIFKYVLVSRENSLTSDSQ